MLYHSYKLKRFNLLVKPYPPDFKGRGSVCQLSVWLPPLYFGEGWGGVLVDTLCNYPL
jgi:hypothetical protein